MERQGHLTERQRKGSGIARKGSGKAGEGHLRRLDLGRRQPRRQRPCPLPELPKAKPRRHLRFSNRSAIPLRSSCRLALAPVKCAPANHDRCKTIRTRHETLARALALGIRQRHATHRRRHRRQLRHELSHRPHSAFPRRPRSGALRSRIAGRPDQVLQQRDSGGGGAVKPQGKIVERQWRR